MMLSQWTKDLVVVRKLYFTASDREYSYHNAMHSLRKHSVCIFNSFQTLFLLTVDYKSIWKNSICNYATHDTHWQEKIPSIKCNKGHNYFLSNLLKYAFFISRSYCLQGAARLYLVVVKHLARRKAAKMRLMLYLLEEVVTSGSTEIQNPLL